MGREAGQNPALRQRQYSFLHADKGGSYLDLVTVRDEDHYAYNREFQRTFHLAEGLVKDSSAHSDQYLTDLGVTLPQHGSARIPKRSAHEKYY